MDKTSGGSVTRTVTYYPVAGAMRINSTLYYILKDHLGSASVVTDASGNIVGENRYYPFGETRVATGSILTDRLFTGQREMTGLGIYHYGARFYSPKLGRFLSPDSIVPGYANPQSLNRMSYVTNNPLRYTDPTGHWEDEGCGTGGPGRGTGCTLPNPVPPPCSSSMCNPNGGGGGDDGGTPTPTPTPTPIPTPAPSLTPTVTLPTFTQPSTEDNPNPVISIVGAVLLVQLGIVDGLLGWGIGAVAVISLTVPGAQLGLAGELALIPMEAVSLDLSIFAAEMAFTGTTNHDPLELIHYPFPNFLPYKP